MKKVIWVVAVVAALPLVGCHRDKEAAQTEREGMETEEQIYSMPDYRSHEEVTLGGRVYAYNIERTASDSLPLVKDELGGAKDNVVRLTLSRDGRTYYHSTLTKELFRSSMDENFYEHSILDGIRFVRAEAGRGLVFSLSVSEPGSDMTVPFSMTVADDGTVSFAKEEIMDVEIEDGQM